MIGRMKKDGYMLCTVGKFGQNGQKSLQVHRFVRECYNGLIPDGKVIDYINEIRDDNLLYNLQLMTQQQNCKKTDKKRDYTFVKFSHQNKNAKAVNCDAKEVMYYNSMSAIQKHLVLLLVL